MAYQKTEWVNHETIVSAGNLNKIEDQLESVTASTEIHEMTIKSMTTQVETLVSDVEDVESKIVTFENEKSLSMLKTDKDSEGIFTTVTYKRKADNTVYCVSKLSGGKSPLYTTRTEQFYDAAGTDVIATYVYTLSYDEEGNLISEV